jgi:hypothetical protein
MDLLTTYTHDSELPVITAPPLISTLYKSLLQTVSLLQSAVSSTAVPYQRLITVEILQVTTLRPFLSSEYPATELRQFPLSKVKVTLRLAVYRQSVRLGDKPLETHDQRLFLQLSSCGNSPYVTSSLTRSLSQLV